MELQGMEVVPLHSVPHFTEQCCYLLNLEWKRSEVARLRSLEVSCDKLPTCLVLIRSYNEMKEVIGHSKLSRIPSIPEGCFIESVVIHPNYRRKGLGRFLMEKTEAYAKSRGCLMAYLSTHDQQIFYGKLGYSECKPVSIYGSALPISQQKDGKAPTISGKLKSDTNCLPKGEPSSALSAPGIPPPPPPPLPSFRQAVGPKKVFMNKKL
ncbi:N-alpha-acetyltransferase 80 isoform X2 [Ischnura elegans]|uniref:N-alpha-acetyltransferase 80 isoform X2 n=1 Tax=Ischnura elegans TaxID=197161 RepID=UPI001ED8AE52|nr:N-alpha-acetyltransferase 80 isoform X2 [Ischnura elegans]